MKKPLLDSRRDDARYVSYVVGFILSVAATLLAYFVVVNHLWPTDVLVYIVLGIAIVQLIVQTIFFLHIGRGSHVKVVTYLFALLMIIIIVGGSVWIMNNLDYNMMNMSPDQMNLYMHQHEGI